MRLHKAEILLSEKFGSLAKVLKWDEGQFDCLHQIFNVGISAALQAAPKDDPFYTTNIRFLSEAVRQHKELQPAWDAASSSLTNKETPWLKHRSRLSGSNCITPFKFIDWTG